MSDDLVQRVRDELYAVLNKPQSYCEAIARAIIPLVVEHERERAVAQSRERSARFFDRLGIHLDSEAHRRHAAAIRNLKDEA